MRAESWLLGLVMVVVASAGCPEDGGSDDGEAACIERGVTQGRTEQCAECVCRSCEEQLASCQDAACQSIIECGVRTGCSGTDCYCGTGVAVGTCLTQPATGPCMEEIVAASGVEVGVTPGCSSKEACAVALSSVRTDPKNPLNRANAVSECVYGVPADLDVDGNVLAPEVLGLCETECE